MNPISLGLKQPAEEPVGAEEAPGVVVVPADDRFAVLRQEIAGLLTRSHWDHDARFDIMAELDIKCIRMAAVCRQLYLKEES